jgi:class 3 adenylate cyclase
MSGDDLFAAEEEVIALGEQLVANGGFGSVKDKQHYQELLKSYQKLFRTTRRLMRLSDQNEQRLNAAAKVIAQKNKELEALSTKLSKYLSPQIYNSIFTGAQAVEIASSRKKLTIFFSDVVNSETTDKLESEELTNLLNHYLTEMSKIALEYGGTIDKYIGDAIMAFFGDPESKGVKEDAIACVRMAIAMLRRMRELRSEWQELGAERPFQLRIGINTGYCTVGNFGGEDRMDYTIIGNVVNMTARLQTQAEVDSILIGHETYSLVKHVVATEEQPSIKVKGFAEPIRCYKVLGLYDDLAQEGQLIREEEEGFKFMLDLSKHNKQTAISTLEAILRRLRGVRRERSRWCFNRFRRVAGARLPLANLLLETL